MLKIYIYIGINAHVTIVTDDGRTESEDRAILKQNLQYCIESNVTCESTPPDLDDLKRVIFQKRKFHLSFPANVDLDAASVDQFSYKECCFNICATDNTGGKAALLVLAR